MEFNETVTNNTTSFSPKTYISENAVIKPEEKFLGGHCLHRPEEAVEIYDSKIPAKSPKSTSKPPQWLIPPPEESMRLILQKYRN